MREVLIFLLIMVSVVVVPKQSQAQSIHPDSITFDSSVFCSFSCDNSHSNINQNCSGQDFQLSREGQMGSSDINPYVIFDEIIALLRQVPDHTFDFSYSFKDCSSVCNAAASTFPGPVHVILYNKDFLNGLNGSAEQVKWKIRCILAHEIGHHILGHTSITRINKFEKRRREKQADYFSAFVIRQFPNSVVQNALEGLNSLNAQLYYPKTDGQEIGSDYPTLAHRRQAVIEGFEAYSNANVRLDMFENISAIATMSLQKFGFSSIYRTIDKFMSVGNYKGVTEFVDRVEKINLSENNLSVLYRNQSVAYELLKKNNKSISSQKKVLKFGSDNIEDLTRMKELLERGSSLQHFKAKKYDQRIKKLKSEKLLD